MGEKGGTIVNETRGFDSQLKQTMAMRDKEAKQDYRFMPEPNLLPLRLSHLDLNVEDMHSKMPHLPESERRFLMDQYGMTLEIPVSPLQFAEVVQMLQTSSISRNASQDLLALLVNGDPRKASQIAVDEKWTLNNDQMKLEGMCIEIINNNEKPVA